MKIAVFKLDLFERDQIKYLCRSLLDLFVRAKRKESFWAVGIVFPDSYKLLATIYAKIKESLRS